MNLLEFVEKVRAGDRRALAKAITFVELEGDEHRSQVVEFLSILQKFPIHDTFRIGVTGAPGAGKSTLINRVALTLAEQGSKVAILVIDPSSPISGGSILGDKVRMVDVCFHPNVFIRPSPAGNSITGVTKRTREAILILEAAGFEYVFVETLGTGQAEYKVATMTDLTITVQTPDMGDEIQGLKKGILEFTDILCVNKADGAFLEQAQHAKSDFEAAMSYLRDGQARRCVIACSALSAEGTEPLVSEIAAWRSGNVPALLQRRATQNVEWFKEYVDELIRGYVLADPKRAQAYNRLMESCADSKESPISAATEFLSLVDHSS